MTALEFKEAIQKRNTAWHFNIYPLSCNEECMEAFDDIDNQTIERFYNNYLISNGDPQYRIVVLSYWTVDLKLRFKYLSEEPSN